MFEIKVNRNIISVQEVEPLTSGSVSVYQCHFSFDASWDGFFRSAVFRVGSLVKTVPLDHTDTCDLPWELLERQYIGLVVEVSAYGTKDETEILPTIWDKLGRVRGGAEPGEEAREFTPSVYDRIVSLIKLYSDKVKGDKGDKGDPGDGDMNASLYDPQGRETDIFAYVDDTVDAIPDWVIAESVPVTTDCNIELKAGGNKFLVTRYNSDTLNSPCSEGLITDGVGLVLTYAYTPNYGRQVCLPGSMGALSMRYISGGTVSKWFNMLDTRGGTMAGDLKFQKADNGHVVLIKNHSASADYGTILRDLDKEGDYVHLQLRALNQGAKLAFSNSAGASDKVCDILHTGNKPSGSYTGNGDATERTIATGGIGSVILVWSGSALWLIAGGIGLQCSNGAWSKITGAAFVNGTLSLTTASSPNAANSTYYYQVL